MRESQRKVLIYCVFGLWLVVLAVGLSYLTAGHLIFFASPEEKIESALSALQRDLGARDEWFAVHAVAEGSPCSVPVLEHLLARGPRKDLRELLISSAKEMSEALRSSSYKTMVSDEGTLVRDYGVESTPLLIVMSPEGKLVYKGGYSQSKTDPVTDTVIDASMRGESPKPSPLPDCAAAKVRPDNAVPKGKDEP